MQDEIIFETRDRELPTIGDKPAQVDEDLHRELSMIPDKMAFKIGEVADLARVKPYVIRYWETEFDALKPKKSKNNQRMFTRRDVELVLMIKKLLYKDRFSIEGARAALKQLKTDKRNVQKIEKAHDDFEKLLQNFEGLIDEISKAKNLFL